MDDCEVPLQQLARLKEKLIRHSRAEEAAIKRIRDLEMQVFSLKNELEVNVPKIALESNFMSIRFRNPTGRKTA